jgi:hypothetical protein
MEDAYNHDPLPKRQRRLGDGDEPETVTTTLPPPPPHGDHVLVEVR